MNDDRTLERTAQSWLELGPTDLPDRVVIDTLRTIETTPQQWVLPGPWKDFRMTIPMRLATAAVIGVLALGSGYLLLRSFSTDSAGPRPTATLTASPAATPTAVPHARLPGWLAVSAGDGIWLQQADGSGRHELAPGIAGKTSFDISPDGDAIVFTTGCAYFTGPCPGSRLWDARLGHERDPILLQTMPGGGHAWRRRVRCNRPGVRADRVAGRLHPVRDPS